METLLIVLGVAVGLWALGVGLLMLLGRKLAARRVFRMVPDLLLLFRGLMGDRRIPRSSKVLMWIGAAWIASPLDLVPEFIPVIGALDDAIVAALILRHVVKHAGPDVVRDHWRGDAETLRMILRVAGIRPAA